MMKMILLFAVGISVLPFFQPGSATNSLSVGDFIVDCSACQDAVMSDTNMYSCNVRCESNGK